jgi:hypothetical protein
VVGVESEDMLCSLARFSSAVASLALLGVLGGCGGAAPPSGAQSPASASGVDGANANLDQAEREVALALGVPPPAKEPGAIGGAPPPPPPVVAPAAPQSMSDSAKPDTAAKADPCLSACPALASMRRAATQLCGLTGGDDDARCQSAHERVKHAEQQVHDHCPACSS